MKTTKFNILCASVALFAGTLSTAIAQDATPDGEQLFKSKGCVGCHGMDGRTPVTPMYPKVAGQNAGYLINQLRDIKSSSRKNGQSIVMMGIMAGVSDDEIQLLASWLSSQ